MNIEELLRISRGLGRPDVQPPWRMPTGERLESALQEPPMTREELEQSHRLSPTAYDRGAQMEAYNLSDGLFNKLARQQGSLPGLRGNLHFSDESDAHTTGYNLRDTVDTNSENAAMYPQEMDEQAYTAPVDVGVGLREQDILTELELMELPPELRALLQAEQGKQRYKRLLR